MFYNLKVASLTDLLKQVCVLSFFLSLRQYLFSITFFSESQLLPIQVMQIHGAPYFKCHLTNESCCKNMSVSLNYILPFSRMLDQTLNIF